MPCLDCGSGIVSGKVQKVYQPFPPSQVTAVPVCIRLSGGDEVNGIKYTTFTENNDCDDVDCVDICSTWYEYNGAIVTGVIEIDCAIVAADPPLTPGIESVCNDAGGTWTSPACTSEIRITVSQSDATGPTVTVGVNPPQIISTNGSPYVWRAQAGNVIDSLTLDNNSLNQCSDITWLQRGTAAIPETWVEVYRFAIAYDGWLQYTNGIDALGGLLLPTQSGLHRYDTTLGTWSNVLSGSPVRAVINDGGTLYCTRTGGDIYSSVDGITWNLFDTVPAIAGNITGIAAFGGDLYVGSQLTNNIYQRTGPGAFTARTAPNVRTGGTYRLTPFNGFLWVSGDWSTGDPDLIDRFDGATWSTVSVPNTSGGVSHVVHQNQLFLNGVNGPNRNTVYIDNVDTVTNVPSGTTQYISNMFSDTVDIYAASIVDADIYDISTGGVADFPASGLQPSHGTGGGLFGTGMLVDGNGEVYSVGLDAGNTQMVVHRYQAAIAGSCT